MSIVIAAAAAAQAAAEGHEETVGLPQLDPSSYPGQLLWLAIAFGLLYWMMSQLFLPKIGGVIEERRDRIADDYDRAAELKRQAEEAEEAYNQALADARARASAIAAETREKLDAEIREMQAEADARAEAEIRAAESRIAEMRDQAAAQVRIAARETAKAVVEALIDETPNDEAVAKAVDAAKPARAA